MYWIINTQLQSYVLPVCFQGTLQEKDSEFSNVGSMVLHTTRTKVKAEVVDRSDINKAD